MRVCRSRRRPRRGEDPPARVSRHRFLPDATGAVGETSRKLGGSCVGLALAVREVEAGDQPATRQIAAAAHAERRCRCTRQPRPGGRPVALGARAGPAASGDRTAKRQLPASVEAHRGGEEGVGVGPRNWLCVGGPIRSGATHHSLSAVLAWRVTCGRFPRPALPVPFLAASGGLSSSAVAAAG